MERTNRISRNRWNTECSNKTCYPECSEKHFKRKENVEVLESEREQKAKCNVAERRRKEREIAQKGNKW